MALELKNIVSKALQDENLESFEILDSNSKDKGQGFLGGINFVHVKGLSISKEPKEYHLVIKDGNVHGGDKKAEAFKVTFQREMLFYDVVIPVFENFTKNKLPSFKSVPKCYKTMTVQGIEILVLENLKMTGYEMHNVKEPLNFEHLTKVFTEYAKLHGISLAFKDQFPEKFQKLFGNLSDILSQLIVETKGMSVFRDVYEESVKMLLKNGDLNVLERYKIIGSTMDEVILKRDYLNNDFGVVSHGDCWCNNFMFKYQNNQALESIKIIDWQFMKVAHPMCDLIHFFYCSARTEDLPRYKDLLDIYYSTISEVITKLGSSSEKIFPKKVLQELWNQQADFAMVLAPVVYKICLAEDNAIMDATESKEFTDMFKFKISDQEGYYRRFLGLAQHMIKNNFI